jgi:hypothetical protein
MFFRDAMPAQYFRRAHPVVASRSAFTQLAPVHPVKIKVGGNSKHQQEADRIQSFAYLAQLEKN